jgi:hypothetical protein
MQRKKIIGKRKEIKYVTLVVAKGPWEIQNGDNLTPNI